MSHLFNFPSAPGQKLSIRASRYRKSLKRKRDAESDEHSDDNTELKESGVSKVESPPASPRLSTQHDDTQNRAAGLKTTEDIPPYPFPHRPHQRSNFHRSSEASLAQRLADSDFPIFSQENDTPKTLRQQHLGVLLTILHRCLSEGNYERACQAWGLLLRFEVQSRPFELRREARWGIGAEILLHSHTYIHRNMQHARRSQPPTSPSLSSELNSFSPGSDDERSVSSHSSSRRASTSHSEASSQADDIKDNPTGISHHNEMTVPRRRKRGPMQSDGDEPAIPRFSQQGFVLAREYYERLILQHPYRRTSPHSISAIHFYPAMFSLWIYEATEHSKHIKYEAWKCRSMTKDDDVADEEEVRIRDMELKQAREIAERLDRLISAPPYDKHVELLRLRGMVHLWVGSLLLQPPTRDYADSDDFKTSSISEDGSEDAALGVDRVPTNTSPSGRGLTVSHRPVDRERKALKQQEYVKADALFDKVIKLGGAIPDVASTGTEI